MGCGGDVLGSPQYNGVKESVKGKVFRLTDPIGCVVWGDVPSNPNRAFINQCRFRVEAALCGVGHKYSSQNCGARLEDIKGNIKIIDPYPSRAGRFAGYAGTTLASESPKVNSVVACPGIPPTSQTSTLADFTHARIWTVEKAGGLLTGKCLTEYEGPAPPPERVKAVVWPFYARDNHITDDIYVQIYEEYPGETGNLNHRQAVPGGTGSMRSDALERARQIKVPDWTK